MGAVVKTYTTSAYDILGYKEGFVCNVCVLKKYFIKLGIFLFFLILGIVFISEGEGPLLKKTMSFLNYLGVIIIGATIYSGFRSLNRSGLVFTHLRDQVLISEYGKEIEEEIQKSLSFFTRSQYKGSKN